MFEHGFMNYNEVSHCYSGKLTLVLYVQTWLTNAQRLKTLQHLHAFVHQEHACYSVAHQVHTKHLLTVDTLLKSLHSTHHQF